MRQTTIKPLPTKARRYTMRLSSGTSHTNHLRIRQLSENKPVKPFREVCNLSKTAPKYLELELERITQR